MTNITQFSQGKQVQVSEHQLRRLLEFVNSANNTFNELQALTSVIAEKSDEQMGTKTLSMTSEKIKEYDRIMGNATRTIYMWKYSCYALVALLIVIAYILA